MTDRRTFLKTAAAVSAAGLINPAGLLASENATPMAAAKGKKKIGLQTYSLGADLLKDLPNGLKKVAKMGYTELELFGYSPDTRGFSNMDRQNPKVFTPEEYRKLAEDAGLKITGSHLNPNVREYTKENMGKFEEYWKRATEDNAKLGLTTMVQPSMPQVKNEDDCKVVAEIFNKAGEITAQAGILWGYHNHNREFDRVPKSGQQPSTDQRRPSGEYIEKLFIENTDPSKVFFELDVYWTVMGQQNPIDWLEDYADRIKLLHIKDRWILGDSGMMNFENIFKQAYKNGIMGFYVELESDQRKHRPQFEGVEASAKYLLNAPFVK